MNCVVSIAIDDVQKEINKLTYENHKDYADRIGAEFVLIDEEKIAKSNTEKEVFQIFQLLNKYERVIYLDVATLVRDDCPNLFEEIPRSHLGVLNIAPFRPGVNFLLTETFQKYGKQMPRWSGEYYETSVMVVSRPHKFVFKSPEGGFFFSSSEEYINMNIQTNIEIPIGGLKYRFNRISVMDALTGTERFDSFIINYTEIPDINAMMGYIRNDLSKWNIDKYSGYKYQKHIWIEASAGLGDQINAEPVCRRALKLWPDDDVRITTDYPRIFKHLIDQGIPVTTKKELQRDFDGSFFYKNCNPPQNGEFSMHVDGILSPIVDFASLSVMRRVLSDEEKRPHLEVTAEDINNVVNVVGIDKPLEDYVLIHAGRHWETNAFPLDWWQEIVDKIAAAGVPVILIGKQVKEPIKTGYIPIEATEGVVDTRDLLDLGALFALISKGCMLLTNDSSPVHIAAAFDNDIVVLPTLKLPDHLLPIRYGSRTWRTKALYKRLLIDDLPTDPTSMYGVSIETFDGDLMDYIAEAQDVVDYIVKRYKEIQKEKAKKK